MDLVPYIFHELQEPGSQLCAQHCLNNLLQQPCYTEIDLADVARKLDQAEQASAYRAPPTKSYNYDDTGFFSISVLETALQVWDLTLVRWRGEAMRPFQDKPEEQAGFILNLASHWFTLRRFGARTRWYNLNSFLPTPEWISPTYLHMVITQAEAEGYSVFAVRKAGTGAGETAGIDPGEAAGWEDGGVAILPPAAADDMALELGEATRRSSAGGPGAAVNEWEQWAEPGSSNTIPDDPTPAEAAGLGATAGSGRRRRRQEDLSSEYVEEQDMIGSQPSSRSRTPRVRPVAADVFDGTGMMLDSTQMDDDDDYPLEREGEDDEDEHLFSAARHDAYAGPTDFQFNSRSYDDEDEALQAALKASMADLPDDFIMPELKPLQPLPVPAATVTPTPPVAEPAPVIAAPAPEATEEEEIVSDDDYDGPMEDLTPEEIRAARLARFQ